MGAGSSSNKITSVIQVDQVKTRPEDDYRIHSESGSESEEPLDEDEDHELINDLSQTSLVDMQEYEERKRKKTHRRRVTKSNFFNHF